MQYNIKLTRWDKDKDALSQIRRTVFIEEQNVPEELEWDEDDKKSIHALGTDNDNKPIACARLKMDGHIGRMAVLKEHRNTGIGTAMLKQIINFARTLKMKSVFLHAQTSAIPFYEKQGFIITSDEFMDANIPHKSMTLDL